MSTDAPHGPPGRKVVVVREGPSKKRPLIIDAAVGIIGLLLLLGSVALVDILPEDPVVVPQYKAAFISGIGNPNGGILDLETGAPVSAGEKYGIQGDDVIWRFQFDETNIYEISIDLFLSEDHKATEPDRFQVVLTAPNGTEIEYAARLGYLETIPTVQRNFSADSLEPIFYVDDPGELGVQTLVFRVGAAPTDYFFTTQDIFGEQRDFPLFEIQAALEAQETQGDTVGEWQLRVHVLETGDCPEPDPANLSGSRAAECRIQTAYEKNEADPSSADPSQDPAVDDGNPIRLSKVTYLRFDIEAQEA